MKTINLTEEHKTKLLEMCNKLFPEQNPFCIGLNQELKKGWGYSKDFIFGKSNTFLGDGLMIHWFEFCMTHLILKIRALKLKESVHTEIELMNFYKMYWDVTNYVTTQLHPIDYLYSEFLKLNNK